jgi:hypothetical protein
VQRRRNIDVARGLPLVALVSALAAPGCENLIGGGFGTYQVDPVGSTSAGVTTAGATSTVSSSGSAGGADAASGGAGGGGQGGDALGGGGAGGDACIPIGEGNPDCATATDESCDEDVVCGTVVWARQLPEEEEPALTQLQVQDLAAALEPQLPGMLSVTFEGSFGPITAPASSHNALLTHVGELEGLDDAFALVCTSPCSRVELGPLGPIPLQGRVVALGSYRGEFVDGGIGQDPGLPASDSVRSLFGAITQPFGETPGGFWESPEDPGTEPELITFYEADTQLTSEDGQGFVAVVGATTGGEPTFGLVHALAGNRYFVGINALQPFFYRWGGWLSEPNSIDDGTCEESIRFDAPSPIDADFGGSHLWVGGMYCGPLVFDGEDTADGSGFVARLSVDPRDDGGTLDFSGEPFASFGTPVFAVAGIDDSEAIIAGQITDAGQLLPDGEGAPLRGEKDIFVARVQVTGGAVVPRWVRTFGGADDDRIFDVAVAEDDDGKLVIYLAGSTDGQIAFDDDVAPPTDPPTESAFVAKLDADGRSIWARGFGAGSARAQRLLPTESGGVLVAGDPGGSEFTLGTLQVQDHRSLFLVELSP